MLNVKQQASDAEWASYVHETIADLAALGARGFGFNALTLYSDADKRRPDLYYADPLELFDHCKRTYSRFVTLLHDYPLYEFTILVRRLTQWPDSSSSAPATSRGSPTTTSRPTARTRSPASSSTRAYRTADTFLDLPLSDAESAVARYPPGEYAMFVALSYARMNGCARRSTRR